MIKQKHHRMLLLIHALISMAVYLIPSSSWASYQIRKIAGCACAGNAGNVFPRRRFQRKLLVSDPGMHHGTCVTHVPWCMSGSLTCGDGENVPIIPGACAPAILRIWQEAHRRRGSHNHHYHYRCQTHICVSDICVFTLQSLQSIFAKGACVLSIGNWPLTRWIPLMNIHNISGFCVMLRYCMAQILEIFSCGRPVVCFSYTVNTMAAHDQSISDHGIDMFFRNISVSAKIGLT